MYKENIGGPESQFADAIFRDIGAIIEPKADGSIHRFDDPEARRGNAACWYFLHMDGLPAGAYGNWRNAFTKTWRGQPERHITSAERERQKLLVKYAKARREAERSDAREQARRRAARMWDKAEPADSRHPYLISKHLEGAGLRQLGSKLLVPLRDISGDLLSLQLINSAGEKRYLKDGRTFACFALVGEQAISAHGDLYIAEGWATAATVYKSLQIPVVAAMNAGNLKPVAQAIRGKFPGLAIVIAADNDWKTLGNPGLVKARQAAAAVGACVTCPSVCMRDGCTCTDFNDLEYCRGLEK